MSSLTDRQKRILKMIIEEYIQTATPVGSEMLEKRHSLGVSPATIRNEMAVLVKEGFLQQLHSSAGRMPTPMGFKFYVNELMEEKKLSVTEEVAAKEKVWDSRDDFGHLLREVTRSLAQQSRQLAVAESDEGEVYHAGYANILEMPEFFDIDVTRAVLSILDEYSRIKALFSKSFSVDPIHLLLGDELGSEFLSSCGIVFTRFESPKHKGALGVIGPCRIDFSRVIPLVRYHGQLLSEILGQW